MQLLHAGNSVEGQSHAFVVLGFLASCYQLELPDCVPLTVRRGYSTGVVLVVELVQFVSRLKDSSLKVTGKGMVLLEFLPLAAWRQEYLRA